MIKVLSTILACAFLTGCAATPKSRADDRAFEESLKQSEVGLVLDLWHLAASSANFESYFDRLTEDSIFLGTDSTERWTKEEFMNYAREPFQSGKGWTYTPRDRFVELADDHQTAWVDELLDNEKYGVLRGTAVLQRIDKDWKIAHYSLTFLVPNEIATQVVELIKEK